MNWDSEKIFINSVQFFKELIEDCEQAKHSIHMEYYIFEADDIGNNIIRCLQRAVARGVKVQLVVDGFGSSKWIHTHARVVAHSVPLRIFHPLPLILFPGPLKLFLSFKWVSILLKANQRNHRKICLIDNETLYLGSQNANIPGELDGREPCMWRETGARVQGAAVLELAASHDRVWKRSWGFSARLPIPRILQPSRKILYTGLLRINESPIKRRRLWRDLCRRIETAKARVWITNAYFIPQGSLLRALQRAAKQGADVKILLPAKSDIPFLPWVSSALYFGLLTVGVRIFEYQPSILHAKTLMIDELGFVGSSNLNYRSMLRDLEVDAILNQQNSIETLKKEFLLDLQQAKEMTIEHWKQQPWYVRTFGKTALLFKRWM